MVIVWLIGTGSLLVLKTFLSMVLILHSFCSLEAVIKEYIFEEKWEIERQKEIKEIQSHL